MGRNRTFVESEVLDAATTVFVTRGYAGTSVDQLVQATGVHRGSLYGVFASKHGLFVACLRRALAVAHDTSPCAPGHDQERLDLALVALLDLAPQDAVVRSAADELLRSVAGDDDPALVAGRRLLTRAGVADLPTAPSRQTPRQTSHQAPHQPSSHTSRRTSAPRKQRP